MVILNTKHMICRWLVLQRSRLTQSTKHPCVHCTAAAGGATATLCLRSFIRWFVRSTGVHCCHFCDAPQPLKYPQPPQTLDKNLGGGRLCGKAFEQVYMLHLCITMREKSTAVGAMTDCCR